jgi:hypothetical protein
VTGRRKLPVLDSTATEGCGVKAYVTLEESSVLTALRALRARAESVRRQLEHEDDPGARTTLAAELERLRDQRRALVVERERAYRRKMVLLGHLPPESIEE